MKLYSKSQLALLGTILALSFNAYAIAEDEPNIEEVKRQFLAISAKGAPKTAADTVSTVNNNSFAETDGDFEQANKNLQAAEAALMQELQAHQQQDSQPQKNSQDSSIAKQAEAVTESSELEVTPARLGQGGNAFLHARTVSANSNFVDSDEDIGSADFASQKHYNELITQSKQVDVLKSTNSDLTKKLANSEARVSQLQADLLKAKNKLMVSEAEVDRLSKILESQNRANFASLRSGSNQTQQQSRPVAQPQQQVAAANVITRQSAATKNAPEDVMVVTVSADKAYLRTGPGPQNSPLMAISKGTRLVVETMQGDWYRVITPKGDRAWISRDVIFFNNSRGPDLSSGGTLRISGINSAVERETRKVLSNSDE